MIARTRFAELAQGVALVEDGDLIEARRLVLTDEGQGEARVPMPMILATSAVHSWLTRKGLRTFTSVNVRSGEVLDESLDIMRWALGRNDPGGWLQADPAETLRLIEDDKVFALVTMTGIQRAEFLGIPSSGRPMAVPVADVMRFENGRVVEHWGVMDLMTMMQQLGAVPAGPPAQA